ncbi:class I SAM-dependent methyltransferase [Patescibacteria group bacterium]
MSKILKSFGNALPNNFKSWFKQTEVGYYITKKVYQGLWYDPYFKFNLEDKTLDDYKAAYEKHAKGTPDPDIKEDEIKKILKHLTGESVMEVGFGPGGLLKALFGTDFKVGGADISEHYSELANETAQELGKDTHFHAAPMEELPFEDNSFDTVVSTHTLEHVSDLEAAVNELKRVARKRIILIVPEETESLRSDNYHTQFFYEPKILADAMAIDDHTIDRVEVPDRGRFDLFYIGNLN